MATAVQITNPEFVTYYTNEELRRVAQTQRKVQLDLAAIAQIAVQTIQLVAYYVLADDAIDARDDKIDDQIEFMEDLEDYKTNQDLPMLNCKKDVLVQLGLPTVDMCSDAVKYTSDTINDGISVDEKSHSLSNESCDGVPQGWGLHEGSLMAAKSGSYAGGIIANNARRRQEEFRARKTDLVRSAQQGMKAVYTANDTLATYAQAASIHSGLADLFIQGFNSAGAGLGVALGRLSGTGTGTSNGNPSGSA